MLLVAPMSHSQEEHLTIYMHAKYMFKSIKS